MALLVLRERVHHDSQLVHSLQQRVCVCRPATTSQVVGRLAHTRSRSLLCLVPVSCRVGSDVIIEKHWRGFVNRSILDYFLEELNKATSSSSSTALDISPIITTPKSYLIFVQHLDLFFLSPVQFDVPPLLVLEFLGRIVDVFKDYFKDVSEDALKNNFVTVYCVRTRAPFEARRDAPPRFGGLVGWLIDWLVG